LKDGDDGSLQLLGSPGHYNSSQSDLSQWILDDEAHTMLAAVQSGF
jgi:hypothetical protein